MNLRICFVLLSSLFALPALATDDVAAGKTFFSNLCAACHTTEVGKNGFGPSLAGVVGRKAGSLPDYGNYTQAMVNANLTWDVKNLDEFLTKG